MAQAQPSTRTLRNKVFGLGLARTGTTSMHEAMGVLGLVSAPDSVPLLDGVHLDFLRAHDAFFDNPIPFRYRELDAICPESKWIVTQRPIDDWIASMAWLFGPGLARLDGPTRRIGDRVHRQLYGSAHFDERRLRAIYDRHYSELAGWINGRDHVWLDIDDGIGWAPICDLLGKPVPDVDFPHSNIRRPRRGVGRVFQRQ